jgi:ribonuclease E
MATAPVTPAPVATGLPKVTAFDLPLPNLAALADSVGLQWVNSDASKIAAVQAAIAAEAKPVRVPRERPPVVVQDDGPLVLVETHKDLASLPLPFATGQSS